MKKNSRKIVSHVTHDQDTEFKLGHVAHQMSA